MTEEEQSADTLAQLKEEFKKELSAMKEEHEKMVKSLQNQLEEERELNKGLQRRLLRESTGPSGPEKSKEELEKEAYDKFVEDIANRVLGKSGDKK